MTIDEIARRRMTATELARLRAALAEALGAWERLDVDGRDAARRASLAPLVGGEVKPAPYPPEVKPSDLSASDLMAELGRITVDGYRQGVERAGRPDLWDAFADLCDVGEQLHVAKMRLLHAIEPTRHGPVPPRATPAELAALRRLAAWCREEADRQLADDPTDETAREMRALARAALPDDEAGE